MMINNARKPRILFTTQLTKERLAGLQSSGINIDHIPFITFEYKIPAMWISQLPDHCDGWIFTSKKAVKAIKPAITDLDIPDHIFAVGAKTAAMLEELNLDVTFPDEYNSAALAEKIAGLELKSVAHFCGNLSARDLDQLLGDTTELTAVEVYRTKMAPHTLDMGKYDGVIFMSPSSVESFSQKNNINGSTQVFCIGPTTEQAAHEAGIKDIITPEYSTLDSLVDAIQAYFD